jgi:hypothetical protein
MNVLEPDTNLPRQIAHALEDECARPLRELEERAPDESLRFSDFERRVGEWSFCYGIAWTLARVRDPFLSSEKVAEVAQTAARDAWRSYTGYEFWAAIMAEGREQSPPGAAAPTARPAQGAPGTQLDAFMQRLATMRLRGSSGAREPASPEPPAVPGSGL